jgi:hypothetical protein
LSGAVFSFKVNLPTLPAWATPGSPIPLHTAWKDFERFLDSAEFEPNMNFGNGLTPSVAGAVGGGMASGNGAQSGSVVVKFEPGAVSINNGMDVAEFEARVTAAVARGIKRG